MGTGADRMPPAGRGARQSSGSWTGRPGADRGDRRGVIASGRRAGKIRRISPGVFRGAFRGRFRGSRPQQRASRQEASARKKHRGQAIGKTAGIRERRTGTAASLQPGTVNRREGAEIMQGTGDGLQNGRAEGFYAHGIKSIPSLSTAPL